MTTFKITLFAKVNDLNILVKIVVENSLQDFGADGWIIRQIILKRLLCQRPGKELAKNAKGGRGLDAVANRLLYVRRYGRLNFRRPRAVFQLCQVKAQQPGDV